MRNSLKSFLVSCALALAWLALSVTAGIVLGSALPGCTPQAPAPVVQQQVDHTADLINEVAKRGDQVYAVSVERCHQAELAASKLPDLEEAKGLVLEIRARCDQAFEMLETLRRAIETVDATVDALERGAATVRQAAGAAMLARDAFDAAQVAHDDLDTYLGSLGL